MSDRLPRGQLIVGLFPQREVGTPGATPREFLRSTVAIGTKLEHSKQRRGHLTMTSLIEVVNTVFSLVPALESESKHKLSLRTLKRRCFESSGGGDDVVYSYMGTPYQYLNGNDETQMSNYRSHVEANGLQDLIDWLVKVVLAELETSGAAEGMINAKVFTELEKRALRIEIVGIEALDQPVDADLDIIIAPAPAPALVARLPVFRLRLPNINVANTPEPEPEAEDGTEETEQEFEMNVDTGAAYWNAAHDITSPALATHLELDFEDSSSEPGASTFFDDCEKFS